MTGFDFCLSLNRWREEVILEQAVGGLEKSEHRNDFTFRTGLLPEVYLWKGGQGRKQAKYRVVLCMTSYQTLS